jgi:hypothetical protein
MVRITDLLPGSWDVLQVSMPNGDPAYSGTIRIKARRDVFDFDWQITAGEYVGIGLINNDHILVSCGEQYAGLGVALYQIQPDSSIRVQWSTPELQGYSGSGSFASSFSGSFEGEHELTQYLPDGSLHGRWTVDIRATGSLFNVTWRKSGAVHFSGLGFATSHGLAVGWYPDCSQLAFLDYSIDPASSERLLAVWALGGFTTLGSEILKRQ